jgi:hypothetical protein
MSVLYWATKSGLNRSMIEAGARTRENSPISHLNFHTLTGEMAWVLGLIFSDGTILNNNYGFGISVGKEDVAEVDKLKQIFLWRGCVVYNNNGCYQYTVGSKDLCDQLRSIYSLDHNKTYSMKFPAISAEMMPHFVRGLWDGDGSWYSHCQHREYETRILDGAYTSSSKDFVVGLHAVLRSHVGIRKPSIRYSDRKKQIFGYNCNPYYSIELGHMDSCAVGEWMYRDSLDENRYSRKHLIWNQWARPTRYRYGDPGG